MEPVGDQPELVPVGRRNGWRPAAIVVLAAIVILGVVVWKPWADGQEAANPVGSSGSGATVAAAAPSQSAPAFIPSQPPITIAGLDLLLMDTMDRHRDWGVAVAYVSEQQFRDAAAEGRDTVTPVVSWQSIGPGTREPGPTLDHARATSVAIAATWPEGVRPIEIRLRYGPPRRTGDVIELGDPLEARLRISSGSFGDGEPMSGNFYLPSPTLPADPAGWIGHGWPVGSYVLEVLMFGQRNLLPFVIAASDSP